MTWLTHLTLDQQGARWHALARALHQAILAGHIPVGERLPGVRKLAEATGLSNQTVVRAVKWLESQGVVAGRERSGFRVLAIGQPQPPAAATDGDAGPRKRQEGRYGARGVSSTKDAVHAVVDRLDRGLFPGAFCKIHPDFLTGDPEACVAIHADGAGTKSLVAYLLFRECGDPSVFRATAQDSLVMNLDDLLCIGALDRILFSSTVNRNARRFSDEALAELIAGTEAFLEKLRGHGIGIWSGGGETADVGDLTGTVTVDSCAVAVLKRHQVIDAAAIGPGLAIVGLASDGQATYEDTPNSGIGSNGLTSARHDLLHTDYASRYPETFDGNIDRSMTYCGPYHLDDPLPDSDLTVGAALLSPTRTYAPVIHRLLEEQRPAIRGLIHCSGGGQTKCLRFGAGVHYIKDKPFRVPPIFRAIQKASRTPWEEMFQVFNMGHRMEVYCAPAAAEAVIATSQAFGIDAQVVGRTEATTLPAGENHLSIHYGGTTFRYRA
ncbi:MAG: GntR family transcriptional regulator [Opitutales bacterium]